MSRQLIRRRVVGAGLMACAMAAMAGSLVSGWQGRGAADPRMLPAVARTTPLFPCGSDETLQFPEPVSWPAIALAADRRLYIPCSRGPHTDEHREARDAQLLDLAFHSQIAEFRRQAIAAYGRLGRPEFVANHGVAGVLLRALDDPEPIVRREAANAIGDALSGTGVEPDDGGPALVPAELVNGARAALQGHLPGEQNLDVAAMEIETIGRLKYGDDFTRQEVEVMLVSAATGEPTRVLAAVKGLEALLRANPRRPIQPATRDLLRFLAVDGPTSTPAPTVAGRGTAEVAGDEAKRVRIRRLAMQALQTARDTDLETVLRASRDADWQVRRFAAMRLDPANPDMTEMRALLAGDRDFQVRYEVVGVEGRVAAVTHDCHVLVNALDDPETAVVVRALDVLPKGCEDADFGPKLKLMGAFSIRFQPLGPGFATGAPPAGGAPPSGGGGGARAGGGGRGGSVMSGWHVGLHAFLAMERLSPIEVTPAVIESVARHPAWQVRAAVAAIAAAHRNDKALMLLARDADPNVRAAALEAMAYLKTDEAVAAEIAALDSPAFQVIRAATSALKGTPEDKRGDVSFALLAALTRLTTEGWDTSRDPRIAILQRLQEVMPAEYSGRLAEFADDFDPKIRAIVGTVYRALTGSTALATGRAVHRYPLQPTAEQLAALPAHATLKLTGSPPIEMDLLIREAPITIARFAELVKAGYYNGLTFHRVVPNFVVQGGSHGANEYVGVNRYWRDELGTEPHLRGAVGISTRGRDTGDGQIFIDLIDLPRLDHDYTVFARVVSGLDVVDRILDGARIDTITVR